MFENCGFYFRSLMLFITTCAALLLVRFEAWPGQLSTKIYWGAVLVSALLIPGQSRVSRFISLILIMVAVISAVVTTGAYYRQSEIMVFGPSHSDVIAGTLGIMLTIYCTWRWGARPLAILAAVFVLFALGGGYLPGEIGHSPIDLSTLVNHLYIGTEGMFGIALNVILHVVFVFIILTALLEVSGGSGAVVALSMRLFGSGVGSPGKVSVAASALFGTMTGAAVANVIASGSVTIPMMKKSGYRPSEAAAIESVASTGSQIMPPVLGSAGFIMAEMLQLPFSQILMAATLPAVFYYLTLFAAVHASRVPYGNERVVLDTQQSRGGVRSYLLLTPIAVLLVCLLGFGFTASTAAMWAILSVPAAMFLATGTIISIRTLYSAAVNAAHMMVPIGLLGASAGIIIGVFSLTGLGQKLVNALLLISDGNIIFVLLLTMVSSIVLGMGLPTVAVYIILALTVAPAMIQAEIHPLVAHFFVFYYGVLAAITPPVALATIAAASVANASIWETGMKGIQLAIVPYTLPFIFVLQPGLLGVGEVADIGSAILLTAVFSLCAVISSSGYLLVKVGKIQRVAFGLLALAILVPVTKWWAVAMALTIYAVLLAILWRGKLALSVRPSGR